MKALRDLKIKLFADCADISNMKEVYSEGIVKGFTTNPTLMKKANISNYEAFAMEVLSEIKDLPVSFEVFSDEFDAMEREAKKIASWGKNVYVKIPVTNTKGESSVSLIKMLSEDGFQLNITAILTLNHVQAVTEALSVKAKSIVSIFAGRIADTGRDPVPVMNEAVKALRKNPNAELLWASSREILNIFQAESCGCHIITITDDIIKKLHLIGMDLSELSLDTVRMFFNDGQRAGYRIAY